MEEIIDKTKKKPTFMFISRYPIYCLKFISEWMRPFQEKNPDANILLLGIQEFNSYLSISPILRWAVRGSLTEKEKENFYILYDERKNILTEILYQKLNLKNKFGAYFFLLDNKGRVSLRGVGRGDQKDIDLLNMTYIEEIDKEENEDEKDDKEVQKDEKEEK